MALPPEDPLAALRHLRADTQPFYKLVFWLDGDQGLLPYQIRPAGALLGTKYDHYEFRRAIGALGGILDSCLIHPIDVLVSDRLTPELLSRNEEKRNSAVSTTTSTTTTRTDGNGSENGGGFEHPVFPFWRFQPSLEQLLEFVSAHPSTQVWSYADLLQRLKPLSLPNWFSLTRKPAQIRSSGSSSSRRRTPPPSPEQRPRPPRKRRSREPPSSSSSTSAVPVRTSSLFNPLAPISGDNIRTPKKQKKAKKKTRGAIAAAAASIIESPNSRGIQSHEHEANGCSSSSISRSSHPTSGLSSNFQHHPMGVEYQPPHFLAGHTKPLEMGLKKRIFRALGKLPRLSHSRLLILDRSGAYKPSHKDFPRTSQGLPTFPQIHLDPPPAADPGLCPFVSPPKPSKSHRSRHRRKSRDSAVPSRPSCRRSLFSTGPLEGSEGPQFPSLPPERERNLSSRAQERVVSGGECGGPGVGTLALGPDDQRKGGYCENCRQYFNTTTKQHAESAVHQRFVQDPSNLAPVLQLFQQISTEIVLASTAEHPKPPNGGMVEEEEERVGSQADSCETSQKKGRPQSSSPSSHPSSLERETIKEESSRTDITSWTGETSPTPRVLPQKRLSPLSGLHLEDTGQSPIMKIQEEEKAEEASNESPAPLAKRRRTRSQTCSADLEEMSEQKVSESVAPPPPSPAVGGPSPKLRRRARRKIPIASLPAVAVEKMDIPGSLSDAEEERPLSKKSPLSFLPPPPPPSSLGRVKVEAKPPPKEASAETSAETLSKMKEAPRHETFPTLPIQPSPISATPGGKEEIEGDMVDDSIAVSPRTLRRRTRRSRKRSPERRSSEEETSRQPQRERQKQQEGEDWGKFGVEELAEQMERHRCTRSCFQSGTICVREQKLLSLLEAGTNSNPEKEANPEPSERHTVEKEHSTTAAAFLESEQHKKRLSQPPKPPTPPASASSSSSPCKKTSGEEKDEIEEEEEEGEGEASVRHVSFAGPLSRRSMLEAGLLTSSSPVYGPTAGPGEEDGEPMTPLPTTPWSQKEKFSGILSAHAGDEEDEEEESVWSFPDHHQTPPRRKSPSPRQQEELQISPFLSMGLKPRSVSFQRSPQRGGEEQIPDSPVAPFAAQGVSPVRISSRLHNALDTSVQPNLGPSAGVLLNAVIKNFVTFPEPPPSSPQRRQETSISLSRS